jgi:hypothetical protein
MRGICVERQVSSKNLRQRSGMGIEHAPVTYLARAHYGRESVMLKFDFMVQTRDMEITTVARSVAVDKSADV